MAGTRTAPDFTGSATGRMITLHLIDVSGDLWTQAFSVAPAATDAQVEALAAAYQAATNTSLWQISDSFEYEGDADADNAVAAFRAGGQNGINMLYKDPATGQTDTPRLVGPIPEVMQGNQDIPLMSATEMTALLTAIAALMPSFNLNSSQYTSRKERKNNPRVKV